MKDIAYINNLPDITSVTPTICELFQIPRPPQCKSREITEVVKIKNKILNSKTIQKALIYAPDAIGMDLHIKFPTEFNILQTNTHIQLELKSMIPAKTPVCFASMFTGTTPDNHGIKKYEKPVLKIDTLFDVLVQSQKKVAIVAVKDSSIDKIFRERSIDYYSESYDNEVTQKALSLLDKDYYDFILIYHQEYDDQLHKTNPYSDQAFAAMKRHIHSFFTFKEKMNVVWKKYNRMILFAPDHGAHLDLEKGNGDHGLNIPEDMYIKHYYSFYENE
ncbi:MAG: alkaline phosphatase family protein [Oligoflexia bacterium]|nr:alkaline phosphatase family protein [Oligoflexia bacterium]